jgi:hypothetical protein
MGRTRAAVASAAGSLPVLLLSLSSVLLLLLSSAALPTAADEHDHRYRQGEGVVLWANKVGPYHKSVAQRKLSKQRALPSFLSVFRKITLLSVWLSMLVQSE